MELTPFYQKQIECIHCKKKFPSTKIRARFVKLDHQDSDFCPVYQDEKINPLLYNIYVCEHCGFGFTDDFTKYFAPGIKETIQEKISDHWTPHSFGDERDIYQAIEAYKLGLLSGTLKKEKFVATAGLALRIAWLYRFLKNEEQELRFITIARSLYIDSYSNEDYSGTQMSEMRIIYLIAELSRRIHDRELATRYFSKIIERQSTSTDPKIVDMAKERWQQMREETESIQKGAV